jgi:hypothetical protein
MLLFEVVQENVIKDEEKIAFRTLTALIQDGLSRL